jgi:hypothetical protein
VDRWNLLDVQLLGDLLQRHPSWLNDVVCALAGEVRPRVDDSTYNVGLDVAELIWEPLEQ